MSLNRFSSKGANMSMQDQKNMQIKNSANFVYNKNQPMMEMSRQQIASNHVSGAISHQGTEKAIEQAPIFRGK